MYFVVAPDSITASYLNGCRKNILAVAIFLWTEVFRPAYLGVFHPVRNCVFIGSFLTGFHVKLLTNLLGKLLILLG